MRFSSGESLSHIYIPLYFITSPYWTFEIYPLKMGGRFNFYGGLKIIFGGTHGSDAHRILKE